jgi:hypothetical protein
MISQKELGPEVVSLGALLGLLTESGDNVNVNENWFKHPLATDAPSLDNIGQRLNQLVAFIEASLGQGAKNPPPVFTGAQWYAIPNPATGASSPFYIVAPAQTATTGQIGFGVLYSMQSGNLTTTLYAYVPLFSYDPSGATFIADSTTYPCQVGLRATTSDNSKFTADGVTFTALDVTAALYLNPAAYEGNTSTSKPFLTLEFENLTGTNKPNTYHTLSALLDPVVDSWIAAVVLTGSTWLNEYIGQSSITVGNVLVAVGFLARDDNDNYSLNLSSLEGQSAKEIVLNFVFGILNVLSGGGVPPVALIELPGGGLYVVSQQNSDGSINYGLRLAIDITLVSGQSASGSPSTEIDLSLGTWLTGEDEGNNWLVRSLGNKLSDVPAPGVSIFVLHCDNQNNVSFAPGFSLTSVGVNIKGGTGTPLINLSGYTLQGVELRTYLAHTAGWTFGAAARLDGFGFPLGPNFGSAVKSTDTNPVAQSLLQSGSGTSGGGDQNPVNPAFSVSAAYVEQGTFVVQLYDKDEQPASQVTIPIQRALGPLQCQSLGIGWVQDTNDSAKDMLSLLFNGSITLAGLSVSLVGLSIGIPVTTPTDFAKYDLDLNGLGITLNAGAVELSAALVKLPPAPNAKPPRNYTEYDGEALLKAGTFVIAALGSYAYVPTNGSGYASLFIFGILDADLGGPEFFFVTGLAAGFGYNRTLILPDQNSVTTFPLVAGASDPTKLGAQKNNGGWQMPDPATALAKLDQAVPPQRGQYWLAAGVRFTSFDLINSTALLVVEFGNELEIALLGLSWISLPPPPAPGAEAPTIQYAYAELGIEIKLLPSEGIFSATAILTPNSFVIDPACKLTGGFAFYVWFGSNPHAGQFVLTLGGYHPDFTPPSYYPQVPRLGFNWPMPGDVTISGEAYFALTPSAVMAGAGLQVLYSSGNLKAWFKAQMDALIEWAPFHYSIDISVSIGASYRAHIFFVTVTLKIELGASLTLWGPPMGGKVHINWFIISFTVGFGASQSDEPKPLDWTNNDGTGFAQTLLPHQTQTKSQTLTPQAAMAAAPAAAAGDSVQPSGLYTITVNSGLLSTFTAQNGTTIWLVRPNNFVFSAQTSIPTTEIDITPTQNEPAGTKTTFTAQTVSPVGADYYVCVRPMKATLSTAVLTIGLQSDDDNSIYDLAGDFTFDFALAGVPAAKWGKPIPSGQNPEPNELLAGRLLGLANITPKAPTLTPAGADALDIDITTAFTYDTVDEDNTDHLPLVAGQTPTGPVPHVDAQVLHTIQTTLMDTGVVTTRNAIYAALLSYGVDPATNGTLNTLASAPGAYLTGEPLVTVIPSPSMNVLS